MGAPVLEVLHDVEVPGAVRAYTMRPVGNPVDKRQRQTVIAQALYELHEHGWYHGDARWQNAIWNSDQIIWIDFMDACFEDPLPQHYKLADLKTMARSLIKEKVTDSWLEETRQKGEKYEGIAESEFDEFLRGVPPRP